MCMELKNFELCTLSCMQRTRYVHDIYLETEKNNSYSFRKTFDPYYDKRRT